MTEAKKANDRQEEEWREVIPDFEYGNPIKVYVSNFGRVKTDTRIAKERLLKGSMLEGYKAFHFRYFKPRSQQQTNQIAEMKSAAKAAKVAWREAVKKRIIEKRKADETEQKLQHTYQQKEKAYKKELKSDEKKRVTHITYLAHRLVAEYFTEKPSPEHNVVIHKDFDKLNNHVSNVQWVTNDEAAAHHLNNPTVIAEKQSRKVKRKAAKSA